MEDRDQAAYHCPDIPPQHPPCIRIWILCCKADSWQIHPVIQLFHSIVALREDPISYTILRNFPEMPLDGLNPDFFVLKVHPSCGTENDTISQINSRKGRQSRKPLSFVRFVQLRQRLQISIGWRWPSPCCPAFRIIVSLNRSRIRACIHRDAISPYTTFPPCSFEHLVPNFILTRTWTQTRWNIPVVSKKQCVDDMVALRWDLAPLLHREKTSSVCLNFIGS